ncbi:S66 family peptidase [Nocardioides flavescens]|uniref:LD-carboxypeptidase n=1 Tax=Nocardioides flavescens TaxID=2691959 RepID=A0A6L7EXN2_9ACTN|nr:S66 peptidase family protein [Nocardioides flavescens]MXG88152.1 LD-carboxypeptidase [Nocardioides flavescens]
MTRWPRPLAPGDTIAVTAPSSGVAAELRPRLDFAVGWLRERGYDVVVGDCLSGDHVRSASRDERAAELTAYLTDPAVAAVLPPWGGELAIDLVDVLDWDRLAAAEPTWLVGWSDISTLLVPLTTRLGWASLHGVNLMDTPYTPPAGLAHWLDLATAATGTRIDQTSPGRTRDGFDRWQDQPAITTMTLDRPASAAVLGGGDAEVSGTLIGGCVEVLSPLAGSPYADVPGYAADHPDGLLVYLEVAETDAYDACRKLHGLRLSGWFEHATGVLVGRTSAPDSPDLTQAEAVTDALGSLDVPVLTGLDIGHTQPYLPLVNGARATARVVDGVATVEQTLG